MNNPIEYTTKEALENVLRVLEDVKNEDKNFDMALWFTNEYGNGWNWDDEIDHKCESAGCAIGWSANDQWFIERGLYLVNNQFPDYLYGEITNTQWQDLAEFFKIPLHHVHLLFDIQLDDNNDIDNVIQRIKLYLIKAPW